MRRIKAARRIRVLLFPTIFPTKCFRTIVNEVISHRQDLVNPIPRCSFHSNSPASQKAVAPNDRLTLISIDRAKLLRKCLRIPDRIEAIEIPPVPPTSPTIGKYSSKRKWQTTSFPYRSLAGVPPRFQPLGSCTARRATSYPTINDTRLGLPSIPIRPFALGDNMFRAASE